MNVSVPHIFYKYTYLCHIKRELKSPTVTTLEKISEALHIPIYNLFVFTKNDYSNDTSELIVRISYAISDISPKDLSYITNIID